MQNTNPLSQFFRQPAIFLKLPSNGDFWEDNSLEMTLNRELPVYPMTARDEITYRTPDALFNGSALTTVVQSCIPNIKNAWAAPQCDLDTILIAIRIASYGHNFDIPIKCSNCEHEENYELDLRRILDHLQMPDYKTPLTIGDLTINFKPMSYQIMNENNLTNFENQKIIQGLSSETLSDEEKNKLYANIMQRITDQTFKAIANNINSIKTPNLLVTENSFILEFLNNCDRKIFEKIKDEALKLKSKSEIKPFDIKCTKCSFEFTQPFTLDMTSFFAAAS